MSWHLEEGRGKLRRIGVMACAGRKRKKLKKDWWHGMWRKEEKT